jgi:hypothetical protein
MVPLLEIAEEDKFSFEKSKICPVVRSRPRPRPATDLSRLTPEKAPLLMREKHRG